MKTFVWMQYSVNMKREAERKPQSHGGIPPTLDPQSERAFNYEVDLSRGQLHDARPCTIFLPDGSFGDMETDWLENKTDSFSAHLAICLSNPFSTVIVGYIICY